MDNDHQQDDTERDLLYTLYKLHEVPLSEQELNSLTPILNALKNPEKRYDAPETIAEGGEKRISLVYDQYLNRYVAMAQASDAKNDADQERFLREGQLTANLTHPNIVAIHNMGIGSDNKPFFTMELIPGDSLRDIIRKLKSGEPGYAARYNQDMLISIFNKVCDAVAYAHSRNVIHLDIKPDNIRIGQFGEVFLCDWGLALIAEHVEEGEVQPGQLDGDILNDMTMTGTVKGTPGFMSPEQVMNAKRSFQSDIYSLGAILYYMITYQLPVDGQSAHEIMANTRDGNIVPIRRRKTRKAVPSALAAITMTALSQKPTDRYKNVMALQDDLNRFLSGFPTEAEGPNLVNRTFMLILRHRSIAMWLLISLMTLSGVMGAYNNIVLREKKAAETNLALFLEQQEKANNMQDELVDVSLISQDLDRFSKAKSTLRLTNLALKQIEDPDVRQNLLLNKGLLHYVLQHFNEAAETLDQVVDLDARNQAVKELCREYAQIKPDDSAFLSDSDLAQLMVRNKTVTWGHAMYLYYYQVGHYDNDRGSIDPTEHIKVVGALLARLNEIRAYQIPKLNLVKRPEGYHLDMSHTPFTTYIIKLPTIRRINALAYLDLYSLDISHTPIALAYEMRGKLSVKKLRMVATRLEPANALANLLQTMQVEEVTLGKGDYAPEVVKDVRDAGIKVVEEEY